MTTSEANRQPLATHETQWHKRPSGSDICAENGAS
jgi:hypothetical protein